MGTTKHYSLIPLESFPSPGSSSVLTKHLLSYHQIYVEYLGNPMDNNTKKCMSKK